VTPSLQNVVGGLDLRCCDCMDLMRECADKAFDLAIVDPPYGLGDRLSDGGGVLEKRAYVQMYREKRWDCAPGAEYFAELFRVSKNQIVWGGNYFPLPPTRGVIAWDKVQEMPTLSAWEMAWTSFDCVARMWRGRSQDPNRIHPTQKPLRLYEWVLQKYAKPGDRILDTHLGSGSIAIACHYAGHHLTACEIDKDYYESALQRIKRETAQMTLLDTPNADLERTARSDGTLQDFVGDSK
jgi:site-specific DNA-methyltransferase (adenine-specific)